MANEPKSHTGIEGVFHWTPNIKLASALATAGFAKLNPDGSPVVTSKPGPDGRPQWFFWFNEKNARGEKCSTYIHAFDYPEDFHEDHPFIHSRASLINRERYLKIMTEAAEVVAIKKGSSTLFMTKNASPELRRKVRNI